MMFIIAFTLMVALAARVGEVGRGIIMLVDEWCQ